MPEKRLFPMFVLILFGLLWSGCAAPRPELPTVMPTPLPATATPTMPPATATPTTPLPTEPPAPTATADLPYPSSRAYTSLAYDAESDRIIMFGGQTGDYRQPSSYNGETWAFDLTSGKWARMYPPLAPSSRSALELVYQAKSDRVILFGGCEPDRLGMADTWAYDFNTNTWSRLADGPAGLVGPRLAYDVESDKVVLFGGADMQNRKLSDQTWTYDFSSNTWNNMEPKTSPPGRNYQAMTYDRKADRVLMWDSLVDGSMWAYDFNKNSWTELKLRPGAYPNNREYPQMVYNPKADRSILYGGTAGGGKETWLYDYNTNTWTNPQPAANPGDLSRHSMVYHNAADQVFLFGGQDGSVQYAYTADAWLYDFKANLWARMIPKP